jgi:hypothetical protein
MLWLPVESAGAILFWHEQLDQILLGKYAVPIDRFDAVFQPHISLFTRGSREELLRMKQLLSNKLPPLELTLNRFVIGSSGHKDEYFTV